MTQTTIRAKAERMSELQKLDEGHEYVALKKRWTEARLPKLFEWSENINIRTRREVGMEVGGSKKKHEK